MVPSVPQGSSSINRPPSRLSPPANNKPGSSNNVGNRSSLSSHVQGHPTSSMSNTYPPQQMPMPGHHAHQQQQQQQQQPHPNQVNVNQQGRDYHQPPPSQPPMGVNRATTGSSVSSGMEYGGHQPNYPPASNGPIHGSNPSSGMPGNPNSSNVSEAHKRGPGNSNAPPHASNRQAPPPGSNVSGPPQHSNQPMSRQSSTSAPNNHMQNAPAPSPYHRPIHSPQGSRQQQQPPGVGNQNHMHRNSSHSHHSIQGGAPQDHSYHPHGMSSNPNNGPGPSHQHHGHPSHHPHHPMAGPHGHPPQHQQYQGHMPPHHYGGPPQHGMPPYQPHPQMMHGGPNGSVGGPPSGPGGPSHHSHQPPHHHHPPSAGYGGVPGSRHMDPGRSSSGEYPGNNVYNNSSSSNSGENKPMNGNWQSSKDMEARREMIQNIVQMLKGSKKKKGEIAPVLPQMVKQVEVTLYRSASSFEAYIDKSTLKDRLQAIAREISNDSGDDAGNHLLKNLERSSHPSTNSGMPNYPQDGQNSTRSTGSSGHGPPMRQGSGPPPGPPPTGHQEQSSYHMPPHSQGQPPSMNMPSQPSRGESGLIDLGKINGNLMGPNNGRESQMNGAMSRSDEVGRARTVTGSGDGNKEMGSSRQGNRNERDRQTMESKERLRKQQQRLLLLHHSSKCQAPAGKCKSTPFCKEMKRLWSHMAKCEDYDCRVQHCYSSRTILSHYRKCKDSECLICKPVRQSVHSRKSGTRSLSPQQQSSSHENRPPPPQMHSSNPNPSYSGMPNNPPQQYSENSSYPPQQQSSFNQQPPPQQPSLNNSTPYSADNRPDTDPEKRKEWEKRIVHKQQRLLLLRHASKCTAKEGECKRTPHCHNMKKLWNHISNCSDKNCAVPHCISSRYVLMHYRKCQDKKCLSCEPVRQAIRSGNATGEPPLHPITSMMGGKKRNYSDSQDQRPNNMTEKRAKTESTPQKRLDDSTSTLLKSLSVKQIELHIKSLTEGALLPVKVLKEKCGAVLTLLMNQDNAWVFNTPVDPVALGIPDYFEKIKKPMDLGTINKRLDQSSYKEVHGFDADVRLTFANAMLYNEPGTPVHEMAKELLGLYNSEFQKMTDKLKKEEEERRKSDNACTLCGCEKLQFQPPVIFCSGMACQSQRIHRNRHYYTGGAQCNWCTSCYNELDDTPIHLQDLTLYKKDLIKKKNDEINEENWVKCDDCDGWMHQICGLFNPRQNKNDDSVKYTCPRCLLKERKERHRQPDMRNPIAEDLPRTKFSEFLEKHVTKKVQEKYEELALEKAQTENIHYEEALKKVKTGGKITIRQVTAGDKKLDVRERMRNRYKHKNYPEEFTYRCKCILVFQDLDGVDVLLFALYVYEHDERNPAPNTRTAYISYLDSVYYMRPRYLRTFVYHEILISYLDYARKRGYATAHIWACPPLKGDDYIFYAKPEDQKTPKESRLRQWYVDMLVEAQKRSIVGTVTNMYDLYFVKGNDATVVPYLEGDYFSGEIESFIKEVEDGKSKGKGKSKSKKKQQSKSDKTKKMRKGTRSGGLEDDFIKGDDPKPCDPSNDEAMKQLGEFIKPMKDSFIVAYLNWDGAKPEHMKVPKDIQEERERRKKEDRAPINNESKQVQKDRHGKPVRIIDDDSEELECDILDGRQDFLNLCRKNHYQFDQPRRAKHTSMMVLWHLHNPDAAKIVQMCAACGKDIVSGIRYSCETCTDFDLCVECYKNPNTNRGACTHKLVPKSVDGDSSANSGQTEAQRAERRKHIKLHIQLLEHASLCNSSKCTSSNCAKMKQYLKHSASCRQGHSGGCKICKRIFCLLRYHAMSCRTKNCKIPRCELVKERLRQMRREQSAMDDRRRQMQRQFRKGMAQQG